MKQKLILFTLVFSVLSCEHRGQTITDFSGDYRFYKGIAEFFDCQQRSKFYVSDSGIGNDLQSEYLKLGLKEKDDVYVRLKGYLKEEAQIDGIDPITVFVAVKLIKIDAERGCERGIRKGG